MLDLDQIGKLIEIEPGSGFVQSLFLMLIWLNVRSLKKVLMGELDSHNRRITNVELKQDNHEVRISGLENKVK